MTDPTPTPPPFDLAAIRERASNNAAMHGCTSDPCGSIVCQTARDRDALLDRVTAAESSLARYIVERTRFGDAMAAAAVPAVVDAIMRELTADSDKRAREATARAERAEAVFERVEQQALGAEANLEAALKVSRERLARAEAAEANHQKAERKANDLFDEGIRQKKRAIAAEAIIAAVRELHPESIAYPLLPDGTPDLNAAPMGRVCLTCSDESIEGNLDDGEWTVEDGGNVFYPCPTIAALDGTA